MSGANGHIVRTACSSCGVANPDAVLKLGSTPLADTFPDSADESEVYYPLRLQWCRRCGLVQLADVVPDALLYGPAYGFSAGAVPAKSAAHERLAANLLDRHGDRAKRLTVEIACNDGDLLRHFAAAGCRAVGIDPAPRQTETARERGLQVHTGTFGALAAEDLVAAHGRAGLIVALNVAAHVGDPNDFMAGIARLLGPQGVAIVQVQYLGDLIAGNQWDHVYHEHRAYFSLQSLGLLAMRHGLSVRAVERVADQGGSLRVRLIHGVGYGDPGIAMTSVSSAEDWLRRESTYAALQDRVDYCQARILDLLDDTLSAGRSVAGWAASAKSCTLLNYLDLTADQVSHVVDRTPAKIGRYTPGTKLPIVAPGERPDPDVYLHLAWNYLGWSMRNPDGFRGEWLVPIPFPTLL